MNIATWYLPSWYGDIRLDSKEGFKTQVSFFKLSRAEVLALDKLRKHSIKKKWATQEQWDKIPMRAFEAGDVAESFILLDALIQQVESQLTTALKPARKVVRVVKFSDGTLQEISERDFSAAEDKALEKEKKDDEKKAKEEAKVAKAKEEADKLDRVEEEAEGAKATTVAEPARGCPAPDFETVKKRATAVLKAFLTPQQCSDFDKHQRFIVEGADTGHRYMITSRHAPDELLKGGFRRTVYDLDECRAFCVHDWEIPAEEECLTMALLLQLPGRESFVRTIPDI